MLIFRERMKVIYFYQAARFLVEVYWLMKYFLVFQFRSLYVGKCKLPVVREIWTRYLFQGDPFLVFYLGLVILVNARDGILEMGNSNG